MPYRIISVEGRVTKINHSLKVFPGGNYDQKQDDSLKMTAIRETFEESGLLLASFDGSSQGISSLDDVRLDDARNGVHQQKILFQDFLNSNHLRADSDQLLPFTQWVTPIGPLRCVIYVQSTRTPDYHNSAHGVSVDSTLSFLLPFYRLHHLLVLVPVRNRTMFMFQNLVSSQHIAYLWVRS